MTALEFSGLSRIISWPLSKVYPTFGPRRKELVFRTVECTSFLNRIKTLLLVNTKVP